MSRINSIRNRYSAGESITEIARQEHVDRKTVRKYVQKTDFSPSAGAQSRKDRAGKYDYVDVFIEGYLEEDRCAGRKQRHSACRIFERLRDEHGYSGSYETIQKKVKAARARRKQQMAEQNGARKHDAYLDLYWAPGSAQVDFGEVRVRLGEGVDAPREDLHFLAVCFPYSNVGFAQIFYGESAECVCQGLRDIFEFLGCVPNSITFDNAAGVGRKVMGQIHRTRLFESFETHYGFRSQFCNPYSGHEKGAVERKVFMLRSHLFVPEPVLPASVDLIQYNEDLLRRSAKLSDREHYAKKVPQMHLFEGDLKAMRELPPSPFNACRYKEYKTDKYGYVHVDGKHHVYSTLPELKETRVMTEIGAHTIRILDENGECIVEHRRSFGKKPSKSVDYIAAIPSLAHRPNAWKQSGVRPLVGEKVRNYLDDASNKTRSDTLRILRDLTREYGFETADRALCRAVENGRPDKNSAFVLAERIRSGFGDLSVGPASSLQPYDAFLPPMK